MSQTTIIAGVILFAFLIFITTRGDLPKYFAILGLTNGSGSTATPVTPGTQTGLSSNALSPFALSVNGGAQSALSPFALSVIQ